MDGYQYILTKQTEWAKNRGIRLIGSKGERGRPSYTTRLDENLFQPLLSDVWASFAIGDGGELGSSEFPGKMQAVHSSSALAVNVFQYWQSIAAVPVIAAACGFCERDSQISHKIRFEEKYPVASSLPHPPNIDVVFHNIPGTGIQRFAIECKFSEAYGAYKHGGLKEKYLIYDELWEDLSELRDFAESISPEDRDFKHLHPAQLVKHILGLKRQYGRHGFRLLYLWYDVPGEEGKCHRGEVELFSELANRDGISFHSLTYQALITKLSKELESEHDEYIKYLTKRYL